jgi:hypothetical protein
VTGAYAYRDRNKPREKNNHGRVTSRIRS